MPELASARALSTLDAAELDRLSSFLVRAVYPAEAVVVREGEAGRDMFFVLDGQVNVRRGATNVGALARGAHFGELGLVTGHSRAATVTATTRLVVAQLTHARFEQMAAEAPGLALHLLRALVDSLSGDLTRITDRVGAILHGRSLPRTMAIHVTTEGVRRAVATGSMLETLLPAEVDGQRVVAGLVDCRATSLATPLAADATIAPLTATHFEGERIVRRSATLLFLEAAAEVAPALSFQVGASMGPAQWIEVTPAEGLDATDVARRIEQRVRELIARDVRFRQEWWTLDEAREYFRDRGWNAVVELLHLVREQTVELVTCGRLHVPAMGPLVSHASLLAGQVRVQPAKSGLVLLAGPSREGFDVTQLDGWASSMRAHEKWLASLGITSVGAFDRACIDGGVAQTIRVSEGFHEKRLGTLADEIAGRGDVHVIAVAGPSSSGKTTFLSRLGVQLVVDGLRPVGLSLDDYYRDRSALVPGPDGQRDYEALEAIDVPLFRAHVERLLRGERVTTARYDFHTGLSHPDGGPNIALGPRDVLIVEGIHALDPGLLADERVFRVFIQPMTSLALDPVSRVNTSDLRLLRRIVRDRKQRGTTAADNIMRWPSVRRGEQRHIFPHLDHADAVFDTSLVYEPSVLKIYAERYLLEVPEGHPAYTTAFRLRQLIDRFVAIHPDHVPPTSILREFIGGAMLENGP